MSDHKLNVPDYEIEVLARSFLPDIVAFFETEKGRQEFEEWKQQKEKDERTSNSNSKEESI